jgi:hypothetical protein
VQGQAIPTERRKERNMKKLSIVLYSVILAVTVALAVGGFGAAGAVVGGGNGNCLSGDVVKSGEAVHDTVTIVSPSGTVFTAVAVKTGEATGGCLGPFTENVVVNECYVITGLGTSSVTVTRIGDGRNCQQISHIEGLYASHDSTETQPTETHPTTTTDTETQPTETHPTTPVDTLPAVTTVPPVEAPPVKTVTETLPGVTVTTPAVTIHDTTTLPAVTIPPKTVTSPPVTIIKKVPVKVPVKVKPVHHKKHHSKHKNKTPRFTG